MSKLRTVKGILRFLIDGIKEDWEVMEHKFARVMFMILGFIIALVLWWYFFRGLTPFF